MKRRRERFDAEMVEIQKALLQIGDGGQVRPTDLLRSKQRDDDLGKAKRMTVTSIGLMATAYQLAGYAVGNARARSEPTGQDRAQSERRIRSWPMLGRRSRHHLGGRQSRRGTKEQ